MLNIFKGNNVMRPLVRFYNRGEISISFWMMKSDRQLTTIQLDLFVCFYFHTWDILPYHPNTFREISFQFQPIKAEFLSEGPIIGIDLDNFDQ